MVEYYNSIFGNDGGNGDSVSKKWGWYDILFKMAGEDVLRLEAVTKLPIEVTLQHLAYMNDVAQIRMKK